MYLGTDQRQLEKLRYCDETGANAEVGLLLGYPECCVHSFVNARFDRRIDPVLARYTSDRVMPWQMNVSLICFGWSVISHIPCSSSCVASHRLATAYYESLYRASAPFGRLLAATLTGTVFHSNSLGVALLRTRADHGGEIVVDAPLIDHSSPLKELLRAGTLVSSDGQSIVLGLLFLPNTDARLFIELRRTASS